MERFRRAVAEYAFSHVGTVTVSIGFVTVDSAVTPSELVHQADQAMYYLMEHVRNQTVYRTRLPENGLLALPATETGEVKLF